MSKIRQAFQCLLKRPELVLFVVWIGIAIVHCFLPVAKYDDAWFAEILAGEKATFHNWLDFLIHRYHEWSSRSLIEGLLILLTRFPILWRIGDTLICIAITVLLSRLFNPERSRIKYWIMLVCIFLFPIAIIYEVGFIATSLNYSWPFAAALLALTPVIKGFWDREVKRWEYIVAFPMMLLAGFQELICATSVLALLASLVYHIISEKKLPRFELCMLTIAGAMLVYTLTCPGNDNRSMLETATWFPEYADFTLFAKIELGFSSMCKTLFLDFNVFVLIFSLVITVAVFVNSHKWYHRLIACTPTAFIFIFGTLGAVLSPYVDIIKWLRASVGKAGTGIVFNDPFTWIPDLLFVSIFVLLLVSLRYAVKDTKHYWFLFVVLALGAASRMAMGLSPTVWASGERIFAFLYASMAVVIGSILTDLISQLKPLKNAQHILGGFI